MDEALKMMTEFILEMNISQKEEIRQLNTDLKSTKMHNEDLYFRVSKLEELRTKLRNAIFENVKWKDGKAAYITSDSDVAVNTIVEALDIYEHDKAIL